MSRKGRKKAAANTKWSPMPAQNAGDEVTTTKAPDPAPQDEAKRSSRSATERDDQAQVLDKIERTGGKYYHGMTRWLEHPQKHIRVLAVITWLVVLGAFTTGVVVMVLKWDPWATVAAIACFTGATAIGNWAGTRRGPR
jgi:hypothetical protein